MILRANRLVVAQALGWLASVSVVLGQGSFTSLRTGGGASLVSMQQVLSSTGLNSPILLLDFGFVTDETVVPGVFLDSFTVSMQGASSNQAAVLVTADASGVLWAPPLPGAVPLQNSQILRQAIPPPSLQPVLGRGVAFAVQVPVPAQLTGPALTVVFDLFDNQNGIASLGWYSNLQLASVPEPEVWALFGLGFALTIWSRRRST